MNKVQVTFVSNKRNQQNINKQKNNNQWSPSSLRSRKSSSMTSFPRQNNNKNQQDRTIGKKKHIYPKYLRKKNQPCQEWLNGKCFKFNNCNKKHHQMINLIEKKNHQQMTNSSLNQKMSDEKTFLVKIEKLIIMDITTLYNTIQSINDCIQTKISISYKYKKMMNQYKNELKNNNKNSYINKEQQNELNKQIHQKYLQEVLKDKKNEQAEMIKQRKETLAEIKKSSLIKPIITIAKQTMQIPQLIETQQGIIEISEKSSDEQEITKNKDNEHKYNFTISNIDELSKQSPIQTEEQYNIPSQEQTIQQIIESIKKQQQARIQSINQTLPIFDIKQNVQLINQSDLNTNPLIHQEDNYKIKIQQQQEHQYILSKAFLNNESKTIQQKYEIFKISRDGIQKENIHTDSNEKQTISPILSDEEKQEIIFEAQVLNLLSWKKIYRSKTYRNPAQQLFINQKPTILKKEKDKVFCKALPKFNIDNYIEEAQTQLQQFQNHMNINKLDLTLDIQYQNYYFKQSLQEYSQNEIEDQFKYAKTNPQGNEIHKMAEVILRYIRHLARELHLVNYNQAEIKNDFYNTNISNILEVLYSIYIKNQPINIMIYQSIIRDIAILFIPDDLEKNF